jgi:hypothetical protein
VALDPQFNRVSPKIVSTATTYYLENWEVQEMFNNEIHTKQKRRIQIAGRVNRVSDLSKIFNTFKDKF